MKRLAPSGPDSPGRRRRARFVWCVAILVTVALGLASRRFASALPQFLGKYPGDFLWALAVFLGYGLLAPRASSARLASFAILTCFAVECSKLYRAPWLDSLRGTTAGSLLLGQVFSFENLIAYLLGVGFGTAGEVLLRARRAEDLGRID